MASEPVTQEQRGGWSREWLTDDIVQEMSDDNHCTGKAFVTRTDGTHIGEAHDAMRGLAVMLVQARAERDRLKAERDEVRATVEWQARRLDALQAQQRVMRDPERKMVCDILANGKTYEAAAPPTTDAEADVAALKAALEALKAEELSAGPCLCGIELATGRCGVCKLEDRADQAEATAARLREGLVKYGEHLPDCADGFPGMPFRGCICGLDAALAEKEA